MESGEKELKKAFEEVTTRNVRAAVDHGNETRKLIRILEDKVNLLEGNVRQYDDKLCNIMTQLNSIRTILYKGGTNGD